MKKRLIKSICVALGWTILVTLGCVCGGMEWKRGEALAMWYLYLVATGSMIGAIIYCCLDKKGDW